MLARMCRNCNFCAVVRNAKCSAATIKIIMEVPKKIKCRITMQSKKFTPKYILKELRQTESLRHIWPVMLIMNSNQKVKAMQVFINKLTDKQNGVYTYNGMLFDLIKEGNSDIYYIIDELWWHYAKWNKPVTKNQILYDSTCMRYLQVVKFIRTEHRMAVSRGWQEKWMRSCKMGLESQFCRMKIIMEIAQALECNFTPLNCILKNG